MRWGDVYCTVFVNMIDAPPEVGRGATGGGRKNGLIKILEVDMKSAVTGTQSIGSGPGPLKITI